MKVVVAINGTITSESSAVYALRYAQVEGLDVVLFHLQNHKDDLLRVNESAARIKILGQQWGVDVMLHTVEGHIKERIFELLKLFHVDIIFCATRKEKKYLTDSFSAYLLKLDLNTDIAVVHVVKMATAQEIHTMLLAIREDHLSIKKFTFFSTLALAYQSHAEIYSVTPLSKEKLSKIELEDTKARLVRMNFHLRHYQKLARHLGIPMHIKHDFSMQEDKSVLERTANIQAQLLIIGAKRLSFFSTLFGEKPIEHIMRYVSVNMIAFYPRED